MGKAPIEPVCLRCLFKRGEKNPLSPISFRSEIRVGRRRFRAELEGRRCERCGIVIEAIARFNHRLDVARRLAEEGERGPESVRFIREQAGLNATQLARLLGLRRQTIYRWENGHTAIDAASFLALRLLLEDAVADRSDTRKFLERLNAIS